MAFEYTYSGQVYQVGEFSGDITSTDQSLFREDAEKHYGIA